MWGSITSATPSDKTTFFFSSDLEVVWWARQLEQRAEGRGGQDTDMRIHAAGCGELKSSEYQVNPNIQIKKEAIPQYQVNWNNLQPYRGNARKWNVQTADRVQVTGFEPARVRLVHVLRPLAKKSLYLISPNYKTTQTT